MQKYRQAAQVRQQQRTAQLEQRRAAGMTIAQQAAQLLKTEFQVDRVVVFGSLLSATFHESSDLDLAVWGLSPHHYFQAVGRLLGLSPFAVDLVEAESARPELLAAIAQGQEL